MHLLKADFDRFLKHIPAAIAIFDTNMCYIAYSDYWLESNNLPNKNYVGCYHYDVFPHLPKKWRDNNKRCLEGEEFSGNEESFFSEAGEHLLINWHLLPWHDAQGVIQGMILNTEVLNKHKLLEKRLRESEQCYNFSIMAGLVGVWNWDIQADCLHWNAIMRQLFDYPKESTKSLQQHFNETVHPDDIARVTASVFQAIITKKACYVEYRVVWRDDSVKYIKARAQVFHDDQDRFHHMIGVCYDVTNEVTAKKQLQHISVHDAVTKLPNRRYLVHQIGCLIEKDKPFSLFFIDLDSFKKVNDTLGHAYGDQLLCEVANRLTYYLAAPVRLVSRLGGDEFVLCIDHALDREQLTALATDILQQVTRVFEIEKRHIHIGASIGVATYPCDGATVDELLQASDLAMYVAKRSQDHQYAFYHPRMREASERHMLLDQHLHQAIYRRELTISYQPILSVQDNTLLALEVNLAWQDALLGDIEIDEFIPLEEKNNCIYAIGTWVLEQVCQDFMKIQRVFATSPVQVILNFSTVHLIKAGFVDTLMRQLDNAHIAPEQLIIGVLESSVAETVRASKAVLIDLSRRGVKIALNDFGKAHSSLAFVSELPLDYITVDHSFIKALAFKKVNCILVQTIVYMCRLMGVIMLAKDIENEEQLALLKRFHCCYVQGNFIAKAQIIDELVEFYADNKESAYVG